MMQFVHCSAMTFVLLYCGLPISSIGWRKSLSLKFSVLVNDNDVLDDTGGVESTEVEAISGPRVFLGMDASLFLLALLMAWADGIHLSFLPRR